LVIENKHIDQQISPYQVLGDEHDDDYLCLDAQELVVSLLDSYAKFHEDKDEELIFQVCSINNDKVW
jgi:hypothetical protein